MTSLTREELQAVCDFNDDNYGTNNNVVRELLF